MNFNFSTSLVYLTFDILYGLYTKSIHLLEKIINKTLIFIEEIIIFLNLLVYIIIIRTIKIISLHLYQSYVTLSMSKCAILYLGRLLHPFNGYWVILMVVFFFLFIDTLFFY